jgi:effector-binding domain-containing protein
MSQSAPEIVHKRIDDVLIASVRFRGKPQDTGRYFETLHAQCEGVISGPPFCLYRYGTSHEPGMDIEVCLPVSQPVETDDVKSRMLAGFDAMCIRHYGPRDSLSESYSKLWGAVIARGLPGDMFEREIYVVEGETPDGNVTEIQVPLHRWNDLLAENVERVLGTEARDEVMQGAEEITPVSTVDSRAQWIQAAVSRLEALAGDDQQLDILSRCAHVFPQERIDHLRAVYQQSHDVDEVLAEMHKDPGWYANPVREGNVITVQKKPFDLKGYEAATTDAERRRAFCHCAMVRGHLGGLSPAFCYCGTGWYRRPWEGILGQPVRVELLQSLLRGDDVCEVAIHLPEGV